MRKPVTFRFDSELLEQARQRASAENRSLTNFVETAVLRSLSQPEDRILPPARSASRKENFKR